MTTHSQMRKPSSAPRSYVLHGPSLPREALKALQKRGIYCMPAVSVEHQHLANRYVLRGVESGGAVADMGCACGYLTPEGQPVTWLQSLDSIAVNGRHAIYIEPSFVRIEMFRTARTYELAITLHTLTSVPQGRRPSVTSKIVFRGRDGTLPVDLWKPENRGLCGLLVPAFYKRAGEEATLPACFEQAIRKITEAVCCIGCRHTHVGIAPTSEAN